MIEYKRNLPHIIPNDGVFFITFRLHDSLPLNILVDIKSDFEKEVKIARNTILKSSTLKHRLSEIYDNYFTDFDTLLDRYLGDFDLSNSKLSNIIANSIHYLDKKEYKLICYCVMPNHVHLIIYKLKKPLFEVMKVLKGYTAREINKVLGRKGKLWHAESYDNVVRTRNELHNKIKYTLDNPMKARLVNHQNEWEGLYCNPNFLEG